MAIINLKQTGLIIGIAILFTFFIVFAIEAFYSAPKYEDFCKNNYYGPDTYPAKVNGVAVNCTDPYSSKEARECTNKKGNPTFKEENGCSVFDKCDYCNNEYQLVNDIYQRNIFIVTAIIGIIAIIFGLYFGVEFVAGGFLFGGILTLAVGTIRYFSAGHVNKYLRVIVLFIEILILLWIGYKKVVNKDKKVKK